MKLERCRHNCRPAAACFTGSAVLAPGSRTVIKVDVRILAATNINIPEALAKQIAARGPLLPPERLHIVSAPASANARKKCRFC